MDAALERIEVFVDEERTPRRVLDGPPFDASLDTTDLADGDHALRVVATRGDGRRVVRTIRFRVENTPQLGVEGLEENATVRGGVDLTFVAPGEPPQRPRRSVSVTYLAPTVAALGFVWAFFALVAPPLEAAPAAAGRTTLAASGSQVSPQQMSTGRSLFDSHCAACHQPTGEGVPGAFPPLAGNTNLKSAELIVDTIHSGHSGKITVEGKTFDSVMPAFGSGFSSDQIAAVATYVRNAWGNDYGAVSEKEVSDILSKAAAPSE